MQIYMPSIMYASVHLIFLIYELRLIVKGSLSPLTVLPCADLCSLLCYFQTSKEHEVAATSKARYLGLVGDLYTLEGMKTLL